MPEPTVKTITGVAQATSNTKKGEKSVVIIDVMRPGMKYPDKVTLWPDAQGQLHAPDITIGQAYTFTVQAKPIPNSKGEYLDFMSVAPPQTQAQAPAATGPGYNPSDQRASIEAQTRYKGAVEIAVAGIQATGEKVGSYHAAQIADFCWRWATGQVAMKPLSPSGASHDATPSRQEAQSGGGEAKADPHAQALKEAAQALGWSRHQFLEWLVKGYGSGWSQLTPESKANAALALGALAQQALEAAGRKEAS